MPRPVPLAEPNTPPFGSWHILALDRNQCRFICTPNYGPKDQHRYCGKPLSPDASKPYCEEHRAIVYRTASVEIEAEEAEAEGVAA